MKNLNAKYFLFCIGLLLGFVVTVAEKTQLETLEVKQKPLGTKDEQQRLTSAQMAQLLQTLKTKKTTVENNKESDVFEKSVERILENWFKARKKEKKGWIRAYEGGIICMICALFYFLYLQHQTIKNESQLTQAWKVTMDATVIELKNKVDGQGIDIAFVRGNLEQVNTILMLFNQRAQELWRTLETNRDRVGDLELSRAYMRGIGELFQILSPLVAFGVNNVAPGFGFPAGATAAAMGSAFSAPGRT